MILEQTNLYRGFHETVNSWFLVTSGTTQALAQASVNVFSEPGAGSVNSYWITSADGIVVIDAQRTSDAAEKLVQQIKATGKPVLGIVISHPHPDHVKGLVVLARAFPNAPIYSSQATLDSMKADKFHYFREPLPLPNIIIRPNEEFVIGNSKFKSDEIGPGEAEAMTMVYLPAENIVFASDLISGPRMTAFLVEGRSRAWLDQLEAILPKCTGLKVAYPGHGMSGTPKELILAQIEYLRAFRRLIKERLNGKTLSTRDRQSIVDEMQKRYPHYLPVAFAPGIIETDRQLLELNVDAVANELAQE